MSKSSSEEEETWDQVNTGLGFSWNRGRRFTYRELPLPPDPPMYKSKSARRREAKARTKARLAESRRLEQKDAEEKDAEEKDAEEKDEKAK